MVLSRKWKLLACLAIAAESFDTNTSSAPSRTASLPLAGEGLGEFNAHVAQTAEADHADLLAFADLPVAKRRIGRDAGAEQRGYGLHIHAGRDLHHEPFLDDDPLRVAAKGPLLAVAFLGIVGPGGTFLAELLQALVAGRAAAAGIHHAADAGIIVGLNFRHLRADAGDAAEDLMARHHGVH